MTSTPPIHTRFIHTKSLWRLQQTKWQWVKEIHRATATHVTIAEWVCHSCRLLTTGLAIRSHSPLTVCSIRVKVKVTCVTSCQPSPLYCDMLYSDYRRLWLRPPPWSRYKHLIGFKATLPKDLCFIVQHVSVWLTWASVGILQLSFPGSWLVASAIRHVGLAFVIPSMSKKILRNYLCIFSGNISKYK